jgi:hypothetical protein
MFAFGLWWLGRAENTARRKGEGFGLDSPVPVDELPKTKPSDSAPPPRANSIPRKSITAARATRRRRSYWRRYRSSRW